MMECKHWERNNNIKEIQITMFFIFFKRSNKSFLEEKIPPQKQTKEFIVKNISFEGNPLGIIARVVVLCINKNKAKQHTQDISNNKALELNLYKGTKII